MRRFVSFSDNYAISELVGGLILVVIAVLSFALIYTYVMPSSPEEKINVQISWGLNDDGDIVLHHKGGDTVDEYEISISYPNGTFIGSESYRAPWKIGEDIHPLEDITDVRLVDETVALRIIVYSLNRDGSEQIIFDKELSGKINDDEDVEDPMLISSLRTNTIDEDLICYNYTIEPGVDASSYIYNWKVDGNSIFNLLMPFDTNNLITAKDYSGNGYDGTVSGPTWNENGVISGSYQFDGVDDYISLPYCFDGSYIDELTVETWINTSSADPTSIGSFDKLQYWGIDIIDGKIVWTTSVNSDVTETTGESIVNDDTWHHIATTYESSTGECKIFVDGEEDICETGHLSGQQLGDGSTPNGFIGKNSGESAEGTWDLLTYDDFENGFGNYTDGGWYCNLYTNGFYAHQGDNAANIESNWGTSSSFYHTNGIDVHTPGYTSIKIDFWFIAVSMDFREDFWLRYYDGSEWHTVADYDAEDEFENDEFYHKIVWINETEYTFPTNMRIQFICDASSAWDDVYIDQIYVNATTESIKLENFSGKIDEFKIYNRAFSAEQIYQNYLCTKDGFSDKSVIVSGETSLGNNWSCTVTPNDGIQDDEEVNSNNLQIVGYAGGG